ncbi:hypothetical protein LPJ59_002899 [Coemansia sp. RSA 2399]|nr:hypothetical protein LPJ59_002899 [Coemansia sp. RSA 2399]KAJ1904306.1 hypothetical protein LPJ81_002568 [Coemansia sp. IMI 209127]
MATDAREAAVIGVNSAIMALSLATIAYVNANRAYVPLKCKNIPLLNTLFCAMFLWYIGDIYTYQPTAVRASRATCILTMSWLRMSLGIYTVVSCHIFRIYQYHCIFRWRVRAQGRRLWAAVALWAVLPLTYGILASALPAARGGNDYTEAMCVSHKPLYFVAVAFLVLLLACWTLATLMMHGINVCFDEYRELLVVIAATIVVVALQVVLRWVPRIGDSGFAYNTMASLTDILAGQVSLLVLVAKPAFHCLYDRDQYLRFFLHKLRREDKEAEYEMANGGQHMGWETQPSCDSDLLGTATDSTRSMLAKLHVDDKGNLDDGKPPAYLLLSETAPVSPIRLLV